MDKLVIIGGGGHCKVVTEATQNYKVVGFLDDKESKERLGPISDWKKFKDTHVFHIAIGNNSVREKLGKEIKTVSIIHSTAYVSPSAKIEEGSFIGINTVINSNVKIGKNCIINTGSIIEHDTKIDDYSHISYRVLIGSNVWIGKKVFLDMNKIVERGTKIDEESI